MKNNLKKDSIDLLKELISIPSYSGEEDRAADLIEKSLGINNIVTNRRR